MIEKLLSPQWIERLSTFTRLFVGFSGGLDSTVLLHLLSAQTQLHSKITAIHINHGLSTKADAWQAHCHRFCKLHSIPIICRQPEFENTANIEERARNARYQEFARIISAEEALVLAHHSTDQAETVLLHLFRGAGIEGLAAMPIEKEFSMGKLLRPLLSCTREQLEQYARFKELTWIEDDSNENINFSRNYLRHEIMPLISKKWPKVRTNLNRTARICQQAKQNLETLAAIDAPDVFEPQLNLEGIKHLHRVRLGNILRLWLKSKTVRLPSAVMLNRIIDEVVYASKDASPQVDWDNISIRRFQETLYCLYKNQEQVLEPKSWAKFPRSLAIAGLGQLKVSSASAGLIVKPNSKVEVRFRNGGEQIRLHRQLKALKKLFQQWQVPPWLRESIPLIYINNQLACVVGWAVSDEFYGYHDAYQIQLIR